MWPLAASPACFSFSHCVRGYSIWQCMLAYYMVFVFADRSEKESYALAEKWLVEQGKDHLKRLTVPKEYLASFVSRHACCICDVLH